MVEPVLLSASPIVSSPPYQTKTSHALRSASAPSQRRTSETSSTPSPANATIVTSRPVHCDDIHSTTTPIITPSTIRSRPLIGPIAASSSRAYAEAPGVRRMPGVSMR